MHFKGWEKTSLIEYPGKISTVLFTGGCNFRCPFCYNRNLVLSPGELPNISEEEVLEYLRENRRLYQAVIVTGGEPTLSQELPGFFSKVKKLGMLAGLETNGTNPRMLETLLKSGAVDFVGLDVKAPLTFEKYRNVAAITDRKLFENVKKSLGILMKSGKDYELRTTVIPGFHKEKDIISIARGLKGAKKYVLQKFIPRNTLDEKFEKARPYSSNEMLELKKKIEKNFEVCEVRNV